MRFLHTADWHIGKKLQGYDLIEDQKYVLAQILEIAKEEKVDAIVIAGDLYDRSVPAVDAIEVFNELMVEWNLHEKFPIFAISGNHDSNIRLSAGTPWFSHSNYFLQTRFEESFQPIEFKNSQFFLLPYFEQIAARIYFEDDTIKTIQQAIEKVVDRMQEAFDPNKKHILISHFCVMGSTKSDSETKIEVGGLDAVPGELLEPFDYVGLGHLHNKSALHQKNARYSGSPLKFSLSEINQQKGVWIVDLEEELSLTFRELTPLFEIEEITATFKELLDPTFYQKINRENYVQIYLEDRTIIPNMMNQLRKIYPRILGVERSNGREVQVKRNSKKAVTKDPQKLVQGFFKEMTNEELTEKQNQWLTETLQELTETE
ncbi:MULTISPECIES: exonuclease SbcCD subunit D [Enterococcus]|uniref:exonuclease SbcCD subunit D n=1 Tax=Enterococcus TaxID=1350 RepID=UPI00110610DF|nr:MULTISPECIES: exonuclease SbcCD subunit D [Enterococcus]MDB1680408.1 exonuclease SbcCD subunit D [Enterococcus durans]